MSAGHDSRGPEKEVCLAVLPELYAELRHRRELSMKSLRTYLAFCAVAVGWVITVPSPLPLSGRALMAAFTGIAGLVVFRVLREYQRAYYEIAVVIVEVSEKLECYDGLYPDRWRAWGTSRRRWAQWIVVLCGVASALFLVLYQGGVVAAT